jgi:hypothetical protein
MTIMQLPNVERIPNLRPAGAEAAAPAAPRVIPVAPVNPSLQVQESASVVNNINPQVQSQVQQADPLQGGSQADNSSRGFTQSREAAGKPEEPPKETIAKFMLDQIHSVWDASARVVEIWFMNNPLQLQTQNQAQVLAQNRNQDSAEIPGVLAKQELTYSPSKIRKNEKPD